jgi:hypothetical protein
MRRELRDVNTQRVVDALVVDGDTVQFDEYAERPERPFGAR